MIRFEKDFRTCGEQLVLRDLLTIRRCPTERWCGLKPEDFAHDLHGRIFRHVVRLRTRSLLPTPAAVFVAMRDEHRGRGMDGVADYLAWLVADDTEITKEPNRACLTFFAEADRSAGERARRDVETSTRQRASMATSTLRRESSPAAPLPTLDAYLRS
ncbi:hypothetical protein BDI4_910062 [Burkholderia diffusa]|uniref:hypothetical protein n=1 Tax=Burkholderia diffusa TaxID=488732 RepID=UPI001CAFC47F|nr:hypothetical protein [Burkholderia diffusa]CAG9265733.1 hypothetical protein BDI4_910062 [Burkholderia diffusa]